MTHFQVSRKKNPFVNTLVSMLVFAAILILFYSGINSLSSAALKEEKITLETALTESAVHCYALHGYYPETLDYLLKSYNISYDGSKFFVDYQPQGQNLMPDITILEK